MAGFGLVKSFNIDHGELDGMSPQECFVLGYELATIDELLKTGEAIDKMVHADNRERIIDSCKRANRPCNLQWHPADSSESWLMLEIEAESE